MKAEVAVTPGVFYYLEARADSSLRIRQEVKFMPPAPEYDLLLLQPNLDFGTTLPKQQCRYKFIRTRKLLPCTTESRTGKLSRIKDFLVEKELFFGIETFDEIPFYRFNVLAIPPRVIVIGSDFPLHITLQHLDRSASVTEPPPLFLRRVRVQVVSTYETFVPQPHNSNTRGAEHIDREQRTTTLLDKKFSTGDGQPLEDGINIANLGELQIPKDDDRFIPSFSSYGMTLEHELQVEMWGECVKNEWSGIVCKEKVQFVSAWTFGQALGEEDEAGIGHVFERPPPQAFPPPEYGAV